MITCFLNSSQVTWLASDLGLNGFTKNIPNYGVFQTFWSCTSNRVTSGEKVRSCRSEMSCKKGVPKNFTKFTGKHLCWSLFLIKLQAVRLVQLIKKRLQIKGFPVSFGKNFKNTFLREYHRWLLLKGLDKWKQKLFLQNSKFSHPNCPTTHTSTQRLLLLPVTNMKHYLNENITVTKTKQMLQIKQHQYDYLQIFDFSENKNQ